MNALQVVAFIFMAALSVVALTQLPRIWHGELADLHEAGSRDWWPLGEALRRGFLRGLTVGIVGFTCLLIALAAAIAADAVAGTAAIVLGRTAQAFFLLFVVLLLVDAGVTLFNRPKFVVPPYLRDEPGALAMWLRRGSRKR